MIVVYKYKVGDKIITNDGHKGVITDLSTSIIDGKTIASYWVVYDKAMHPDGYARNTWQLSIKKKI